MRSFYLFGFVICLCLNGFGQTDPVGPGRALRFDGIDDYIDLGNIYDDLVLPFSVSAWVFVESSTTTTGPIMVSQDNDPIYNGFWFMVHPSAVGIEYGDGRGENLPAYRRGKTGGTDVRGHWTNVCAVMKGASDVDLFINGLNVGGNYGGESTFPMASTYPQDVSKIGYFLSNGIIYRFKGVMDELRIFNRALSQTEVRSAMCHRLQGNEAGLIGYWNFDELDGNTLFDKSLNGYHGDLKGNPERIYSGAPVGDESVYVYKDNWAGISLTKENGTDKVEVLNVNGTTGIHIYEVKHLPSQTNGMDLSKIPQHYFGVFATTPPSNYSYDFNYTVSGKNICKYYTRTDNSQSTWSSEEVPSGSQTNRMEAIKYDVMDQSFVVDLGPDQILCDKEFQILTGGVDPAAKDFVWSTGEVSPAITVNESGVYSLEVIQGCNADRDSISVLFMESPRPFSLGADEVLCELSPRVLQVEHPVNGFEFTWQDNSSGSTFQANDFGLYWLKIENDCGVFTDSVRFTRTDLSDYIIPNIITPNGDSSNQYFILHPVLVGSKFLVYNRWGKEVFGSMSYQNDWDGGTLPSGVYYYTISGACLKDKKGAINIRK